MVCVIAVVTYCNQCLWQRVQRGAERVETRGPLVASGEALGSVTERPDNRATASS